MYNPENIIVRSFASTAAMSHEGIFLSMDNNKSLQTSAFLMQHKSFIREP
jgi:hypothetical protein